MAARGLWRTILSRDHLALLGDAHRAGHRALGLRKDSVIRRATTAADRTTAAVRQAQFHSMALAQVNEGQFGVV